MICDLVTGGKGRRRGGFDASKSRTQLDIFPVLMRGWIIVKVGGKWKQVGDQTVAYQALLLVVYSVMSSTILRTAYSISVI